MIQIYPDNHSELFWRPASSLKDSDVTNFLAKLSNDWIIKLSKPLYPEDRYNWYRGSDNVSIPVEHTHSKSSMDKYEGIRLVMWMPLPE